MTDQENNKSSSILNSLKKLIFTDHQETSSEERSPSPIKQQNPTPPTITKEYTNASERNPISNNQLPPAIPITANDGSTDIKQMKLKVLGILERLNEQGLDFFEVWNAAAAMGKVDENTIKAAYTSLKYVDNTLTKEKLKTTGTNYANKLKETIAKETQQKEAEKQKTEQDREFEKTTLNNEIKTLTDSISKLQDDLQKKQVALAQINTKYEPKLKEIEQKISIGNAAVNEVVTDIQTTLAIIDRSIS
ncbi:hypothetical protein SF1_26510 [Sphingobacterium faecium NBRC 15299]|uniref:OmpH family outer membrane protein n=1 Tax=Sphingobacterium faecium TaxID=34087 RepID=UPI000D33B853|nr:OmpH family outer membrane protein [Sphingobacterium faecium]PTX11459.1 hypothetical protein C8N37_10330 [Sphingobacterium faecium]GEM64669.1 hypothetical protein SF1_26510 [Sphingobacterium faecium NBRC 15299]